MGEALTWREAIEAARERLVREGIDDADANAEYLALHVLGLWNRSDLRGQLQRLIAAEEQASYDALIVHRIAREPLQYIIGEWEFYGLRFFTTPAALIPRPETEILVEEVLREAHVMLQHKPSLSLLDIGTGSGAIPIAVVRNESRVSAIGVDISSAAIELANRNRQRIGTESVRFELDDVFEPDFAARHRGQIDLLVSNPPYVSKAEFSTLEPELRLFEPRMALTDEGDGMLFYDRIAEIAGEILAPGGRVLLELGYDSETLVRAAFEQAGFRTERGVPDLAGIARVYVASISAR